MLSTAFRPEGWIFAGFLTLFVFGGLFRDKRGGFAVYPHLLSIGISWIFVGMVGISITVLVLDVLCRGLEILLLPWQRREAQS